LPVIVNVRLPPLRSSKTMVTPWISGRLEEAVGLLHDMYI
jgi:hypothetical protein